MLCLLQSCSLQVQGKAVGRKQMPQPEDNAEPTRPCRFSLPASLSNLTGKPSPREAFCSGEPAISPPATMARPPPAGAISASARPILLSGLWRSRQRKGRGFNHLRDLISVLYTVAPRVLDDPHFLNRCLLLDGVPASVTPSDLIQGIVSVQTAVLVRDSESGSRIGLIVLSDTSAAVMIQTPREGLFATCTPATWRGEEVSQTCILDGVADEFARRAMASKFRSLLPPQYLLANEDRQFHLRCIFIRACRATISDGAHMLCDLSWKVLLVRGFVAAAIVHNDRQAGVLVYDDTECTELVARRAPQLLHKTGLELFDSSVFPSVADPADRDDSLLRRLLPQSITGDEERYRGRVLLFTGLELDPKKLDAADFAHFLHFEADIIHAVEAIIIHRSEGLVAVVLGSSEDALSLLQTPKETWLRFFGQKPGCASVFGSAGLNCESVSSDISYQLPSVMMGGTWMSTEAIDSVKSWIEDKMRQLNDEDIIGLIQSLIMGCALAHPDSVMRSDFAERALLLSGVAQGIGYSDLQGRLVPRFGELDASVVENESRMALAMVVFRCWHAAARLSREPLDTWARLGFLGCTPVPNAELAGGIAQVVMDRVAMEEIVYSVLQ